MCYGNTVARKRGQGRRDHYENDAGRLHACLKNITCAFFLFIFINDILPAAFMYCQTILSTNN